jgi:hypothetical protein
LLVLTDGDVCELDGATLSTVEESRKKLGFQVHTGLTGVRTVEIGHGFEAARSFSDQLHGLYAADRSEA